MLPNADIVTTDFYVTKPLNQELIARNAVLKVNENQDKAEKERSSALGRVNTQHY